MWRACPELVVALDERLGHPVDSYVNGSQTWLAGHGPRGTTLEWRLHPVARYAPPPGLSPYELWEQVVAALRAGAEHDALPLGDGVRSLESLWDGLECFPAHGESVEPAELAERARELIGVAPERFGLVDHDSIADQWERTGGAVSATELLLAQLETERVNPGG